MATLLREEEGIEARVFSSHELLHKLRAEDRERILDRLSGRTTAELKRELELRWAAAGRVNSRSGSNRRSGHDRRSGLDRRFSREPGRTKAERRSGRDRRSGRERRTQSV